MAYSTPATRSTGDVIGATQWNELVTDIRYLAQTDTNGAPICVATRSTNQTIANGTVTAVTWNAETVDNAAFHSTSINTSRFTAPVSGWYRAVLNLEWASSAAGNREAYILFNGTGNSLADTKVPNVGAVTMGLSLAVPLFSMTAGQYVEVFCAQSSGGNLDLVGSAGFPRCTFSIEWAKQP